MAAGKVSGEVGGPSRTALLNLSSQTIYDFRFKKTLGLCWGMALCFREDRAAPLSMVRKHICVFSVSGASAQEKIPVGGFYSVSLKHNAMPQQSPRLRLF